jgi:hypothetical protein
MRGISVAAPFNSAAVSAFAAGGKQQMSSVASSVRADERFHSNMPEAELNVTSPSALLGFGSAAFSIPECSGARSHDSSCARRVMVSFAREAVIS